MKRIFAIALSALMLSGCGAMGAALRENQRKIPEDWYTQTLDYYEEGVSSNWANERDDLYITDEEKNSKLGYYLVDLDGDGALEVLIGIIDDSEATHFTDLYVWHGDLGAMRTFSGFGDGYYIYLCEDNVLRTDNWRGSETEIRYMKYDSVNNSYPIIDPAGEPAPLKVELTPFGNG